MVECYTTKHRRMNKMKKLILIVAISLGIFSSIIPMVQFVKALDYYVHFHTQGISVLGNSVIVKVTGSRGQSEQWRWWLAPVIGSEFTRLIDTNYFKNGELATACLTDVGNGIPGPPSCYTTNLNFNLGTDFYFTMPK